MQKSSLALSLLMSLSPFAAFAATAPLDLVGPVSDYKIYVTEEIGELVTQTQAFTDAVKNAKSDDEVVAWVHANSDQSKYAGLNEMLVNRGIRDAAHRSQVLPQYPILNDKPNLTNWFEIFEIDDKWMYQPENLGKPGAAPG